MAYKRRGFSLIEILIAMAILAGLASAILAGVLQVRKLAEDNVYQASSNTIAAGFLEQLLGISYSELKNSAKDSSVPLPTRINQGSADPIFNGSWTTVSLPIISKVDADGNTIPELSIDVDVMVQLRDLLPDGVDAMEIAIFYKYTSPSSRKQYERVIRTIRSSVR